MSPIGGSEASDGGSGETLMDIGLSARLPTAAPLEMRCRWQWGRDQH